MWTYKGFSSREANAVEVHACDEDRLALDAIGESLGNLKSLGGGLELGMGRGRHCDESSVIVGDSNVFDVR